MNITKGIYQRRNQHAPKMTTQDKAQVIAGLIENKPLREIGKEVGKHYTTIHKFSNKDEIKKLVEDNQSRLVANTIDKIVDIDIKMIEKYYQEVVNGDITIDELENNNRAYSLLEKKGEAIKQSVGISPTRTESPRYISLTQINNQLITSDVLSLMSKHVIDITNDMPLEIEKKAPSNDT